MKATMQSCQEKCGIVFWGASAQKSNLFKIRKLCMSCPYFKRHIAQCACRIHSRHNSLQESIEEDVVHESQKYKNLP
jgi:hypothetical protein